MGFGSNDISSSIVGVALMILLAISFAIVVWYIFQPALLASRSTAYSLNKKKLDDADDYFEEVSFKSSHGDSDGSNSISSLHLLSLVIPAYNEEERLPSMLDETIIFLQEKGQLIAEALTLREKEVCNNSHSLPSQTMYSFEIIVVDDGSTDRTSLVAADVFENIRANEQHQNRKLQSSSNSIDKFETKIKFRIIQLKRNRGKGAAVKIGMLHSNAEYVLMVDADGATDINALIPLSKEMNATLHSSKNNAYSGTCKGKSSTREKTYAVAVGSRAHLAEESTAKRTLIRSILMHAFHFFVKTLCSASINDTQCGFKLFTRDAAILLFSTLHLERWAFDIEIITLAEKLSIPMIETGVNWQEIDGSKLDTSKIALLVASVNMLRDMVCVNLCYSFGIWKLPKLRS